MSGVAEAHHALAVSGIAIAYLMDGDWAQLADGAAKYATANDAERRPLGIVGAAFAAVGRVASSEGSISQNGGWGWRGLQHDDDSAVVIQVRPPRSAGILAAIILVAGVPSVIANLGAASAPYVWMQRLGVGTQVSEVLAFLVGYAAMSTRVGPRQRSRL